LNARIAFLHGIYPHYNRSSQSLPVVVRHGRHENYRLTGIHMQQSMKKSALSLAMEATLLDGATWSADS
jgi:hypothetical protein